MGVSRPEPQGPGTASEAGFTLVEALIAIIVLVFGLIAITNLMIMAGVSNTVGNHTNATTNAASSQMERLKAMKFADVAVGGDIDSDVTNFNITEIVPGVGSIHTRWKVTSVDGQVKYIQVRSDTSSKLAGLKARAEFTSFRACTAVDTGCPEP